MGEQGRAGSEEGGSPKDRTAADAAKRTVSLPSSEPFLIPVDDGQRESDESDEVWQLAPTDPLTDQARHRIRDREPPAVEPTDRCFSEPEEKHESAGTASSASCDSPAAKRRSSSYGSHGRGVPPQTARFQFGLVHLLVGNTLLAIALALLQVVAPDLTAATLGLAAFGMVAWVSFTEQSDPRVHSVTNFLLAVYVVATFIACARMR